jgi:hypothetical protein
MSILRLVRNFALLAVLALAAHAAAGADARTNPHCGGICDQFVGPFCAKQCVCVGAAQGGGGRCVPKNSR